MCLPEFRRLAGPDRLCNARDMKPLIQALAGVHAAFRYIRVCRAVRRHMAGGELNVPMYQCRPTASCTHPELRQPADCVPGVAAGPLM